MSIPHQDFEAARSIAAPGCFLIPTIELHQLG
jgi:hypothetical protein